MSSALARPDADPDIHAVNAASSSDFQPLAGVRVIDFTRVLAGPYATMTLAELGADVVKVEMPGIGDETRAWGPPFIDHSSAYFHAVNRGKRSIEVDLSVEEGRRTVDRLLASADVVVENFRPGVPERLGLDAEQVMARHPQLIYASITGFGRTGPMASDAGTEVIVEAESGLMSVTGEPGAAPVRFGVAMVDIATGLTMINGILAALVERGRTQRGRRIDVSLYATAVSSLGTVIAASSAGGAPPRPWGSAHPSIVPYRAFAAADGHVVLGATNDAMFRRLVVALDLAEELGGPEWATNAGRVEGREELEEIVQRSVALTSVDHVVARLRAQRVLVAPVLRPDEAAASEQARALGLLVEEDGVLMTRGPLAASQGVSMTPAPALGQHTQEILAELFASATEGQEATS
ncbi:CoA transferase [Aeromicrobium sp. YIM 150415]|uniref:CaiB/BaiF CoA transferase family protein n=1 Tax=Aeromicrobium sp. YIM 150415 TaxID=2803912 RepID=UPI0019631D6A|nr:CoA transferase [Aeromicrobium sp. YIM 150415]MBM9462177.1 CoA transferase [Aeromicrobium sp. YIM 150415]